MAKNNLKSINNNSSFLNSTSQVFSKYSYTYNFFFYLNIIKLSITFFNKNRYYSYRSIVSQSNFNFFFYKNVNNFISDNSNNLYIFSELKFFFLNGKHTILLDYFNFDKIIIKKKNVNHYKMIRNINYSKIVSLC